MKMTLQRARAILSRYEQLKDEAERFADGKRRGQRRGPIRFDDELIEMEINTSCHCHPEYVWVKIGTFTEFCEWLDKKENV